jgi:hypothetical protein
MTLARVSGRSARCHGQRPGRRRRHRRRGQADPPNGHVLGDWPKQAYIPDHPLRPALQRPALAMTCMPPGSPSGVLRAGLNE